MTKASIASANYQVQLTNGRHRFSADEPKNLGGADSSPAPDELLEASLASCTAITLRMYADRKGWMIPTIEVSVSLERIEGKTIFSRQITILGEIAEEQRQRLLQIAHDYIPPPWPA